MRTSAIVNQKGGCGKTTVAINLAATLARQGRRTLLVDMDPQGHCGLGLSVPEEQVERSISALLTAGLSGAVQLDQLIWQAARRLDLIPATMSLAGVEQRLSGASDKDRRLAQVLSPLQERYEFCIIDCPPSIGLLTFNALRAASEVIVPVETGYFALQGAKKQQQTIEMLAQRVAHRLNLHVLATMHDPAASHARAILAELQRHFADFLAPATVHLDAQLQAAAGMGQAITEFAPESRSSRDFADLAAWLIEQPTVPTAGEQTVDLEPGEPVESMSAAAAPTREAEPTPATGKSRAAELVERARQLSARTAELSDRLHREGTVDSAGEPAEGPGQPEPAPPAAGPPEGPGHPALVPALERGQAPTATAAPGQLSRTHGARATASGLLFVQPLSAGQQLAVAGTFNNWDPAATPLKPDHRLGVWQACVAAPAGRHRYQLVVDGRWLADPYNSRSEQAPDGRVLSLVDMQPAEQREQTDSP
jgi:chromosome partitioning protein